MPRMLWAAVCLVALSGCHIAPVPDRGQPTGEVMLPLDGAYDVTMHTYLLGSITGRMYAEPTQDGFKANTRPDVAWQFIGGLEGFVGPLLAPGLFPGGVIASWTSGLPENGKPGMGTIGAGKAFSVSSSTWSPTEPIELLYNGNLVGLLSIEPARQRRDPRAEYEALADKIERTLRDYLYDPQVAESSSVKLYMQRVRSAAAKAKDDLEFGFGVEMARRRSIGFSQLGLLRELDQAYADRLTSVPSFGRALVRADYDSPANISTIAADWFDNPDDVDRAFDQALEVNPRALVVDLRYCRGGNLSALAIASRIIDEPVEAGAVLARELAGADAREMARTLPRKSLAGVATYADLRKLVEEQGSLVGVVEPAAEEKRWKGPVYVLTSKRTAATGELLASVLQASGRATLVGERTAGRMLGAGRFHLGNGWVLQLPMFGFVTAEGEPIEGRGVIPDVAAAASGAPKVARRMAEEAAAAPSRTE